MTKTECGRLGGKATVKAHGAEHMREIGKKGAAAFWKKYQMLPAGTSGWAIIDRATNKVVKTIGILPGRLEFLNEQPVRE